MPHPDYLYLYSLSAPTRYESIYPRSRVLTPRLVRMSNGLSCSRINSSTQSATARQSSAMVEQSKGIKKMVLQNYETVAQRLERFWTDHPSGRISTELLEGGSGYWIFKARIYSKADDAEPISTGHAHETIGASQINKTSALEVCETSAVGRALALAGYHNSRIASFDELTRAKARAEEPAPMTTSRPQRIRPPVKEAAESKDASITGIGVKKYLRLIQDATSVGELMQAAEVIANDNSLEDFQKDLLRGNWANRRTQILTEPKL